MFGHTLILHCRILSRSSSYFFCIEKKLRTNYLVRQPLSAYKGIKKGMEKTFKHLTKSDRIKMEALLKAGHSKAEIAEQLHVHRSTVYREIKRGVYTALNSDLTQEERYSPDIADDKYKENLKSKGGVLKIGNDIKFANYIENKIVNDGYSPAAVLGELKAKNREGEFSVTICVTTLYSYIDKGIFLRLTHKDLPVKAK